METVKWSLMYLNVKVIGHLHQRITDTFSVEVSQISVLVKEKGKHKDMEDDVVEATI